MKISTKLPVTIVLPLIWLGMSVSPASAQSWSNGYAFRRAITIDHTKVPNTDQANFPVLISGTYPYLAGTSSGGDVTSSSGYDIIFASDSAGTSLLPFERESYSGSTGAVNYWVKVPTLSHTTDTVIYMFYGNGSITTDPSSKTAVWDTNYKGVWHLPNGTSLSAIDSTSNANNGTPYGNVSAAAGKIDGASSSPGGTGNGISTTNSITPDTSPFTYSFWVNSVAGGSTIWRGQDGFGNGWSAGVSVGSNFTFSIVNSAPTQINLTSNTTVVANTWYHVVAVWAPGSGMKLYVNGALDASNTNSSTTLRSSTKGLQFLISNGGSSFNGVLDEVEVSNAARAADWIAAEYNNQNSPATFYSVAAADVNGLAGSTAPYIAGSWPASGPVTAPVTILGANFGATQGSSLVTFNGTPGSPSLWTDSSILVSVPSTATSGNIVVTASSMPSNASTFTVTTAPGIWSTSPASGIVGLQVTLSGINFGTVQGASNVALNGAGCSVVSWSNTAVTVVVPSGATSGPFIVTVGDQSASSPVFTVSPIPTGWLDQDVGQVGVAGNALYAAANGKFTLQGSGADIYGTSDAFHFVYQPLNGDGTIVARVVSLQGSGTNPKAGVMIREALTPGSKNVFTAFQPGSLLFQYRSSTGAATSQSTFTAALPYWVKLARSGNSFSGYRSFDGMNWTQIGSTQTISMAQSVFIGLAADDNNNSALATAVLDGVSITSSTSTPPVITAVSATTGAIGSQVLISGTGFGTTQGNSLVLLNGIPMTVNSVNAK